MKIKFFTAVFLLSTANLFSGCAVVSKLAGSSAPGTYSALLSKKEELAGFQPSSGGALSGKETPKIKGKVVIVRKEAGAPAELDCFNYEGKFSEEPAGSGKASLFYPPEVYAKKPEEIDTLIKIECREDIGSDFYKANGTGSSQRLEYRKTFCDISVIDYQAKTLLAKVQKSSEAAPDVITPGEGGDGFYKVFKEIADYLKSLPLELLPRIKPTPNGATLAVAEIVKSHKKSEASVSQYQDKEITVVGWGRFIKPGDFIEIYGNDKATGVDSVTCKIDPNDTAGFAEVKEYEIHKFTVVGKFNVKHNIIFDLEQCRLVDAEKIAAKK